MVKNLSAMQEIRVQSLGQEDPLEKGMAPLLLSWLKTTFLSDRKKESASYQGYIWRRH